MFYKLLPLARISHQPSRQLLRYVGPLHRLKAPTVGALLLHIHVHIATKVGEKCWLDRNGRFDQ
jgi:hypothetical protein